MESKEFKPCKISNHPKHEIIADFPSETELYDGSSAVYQGQPCPPMNASSTAKRQFVTYLNMELVFVALEK